MLGLKWSAQSYTDNVVQHNSLYIEIYIDKQKQACMWAIKQMCHKRVSTSSPGMCACISVCMHMYGAIVQELIGRRAVSPFQSDPGSLLSCVMWICYDTLCGHAKLNKGSHRRSHTYLSCDFHCFIYAKMCIIQDKCGRARACTHTHGHLHNILTQKM